MIRFFSIVIAAFLWSWAAIANVDVNAATESELTSLPGIGPAKAAAIVQHRTAHGPFKNLSDLDAVSGIGPATLANITPLVTFSGSAAAPATNPAGGETAHSFFPSGGLAVIVGPSPAQPVRPE